MERTLSIIKPDGVARGLIGDVIHRFEENGLKIIAEGIMTKSLKSLVILLAASLSLAAFAKTEEQRAAIIERIKPHGQVCMAGDSSCATATC